MKPGTGDSVTKVRNRIKHCGACGARIDRHPSVGEQRCDGIRNVVGQCDLDENQRVICKRRMKERETFAVRWIQAPPQIAPAGNLVHGFVVDDFFEHYRRCVPVDGAQLQEAAVEPGIEQVLEVGVDFAEFRVLPQLVDHVFAHAQQAGGAAGRKIQASQQFGTA